MGYIENSNDYSDIEEDNNNFINTDDNTTLNVSGSICSDYGFVGHGLGDNGNDFNSDISEQINGNHGLISDGDFSNHTNNGGCFGDMPDLKSHLNNLQVAFEGNHYDQNALDFLDECHRKGVELPSSVDHSSFKSESIVDRSVDGGFKSIDKTLIRDSLNNELEKGNLSKEEYDKLDSMLSRT